MSLDKPIGNYKLQGLLLSLEQDYPLPIPILFMQVIKYVRVHYETKIISSDSIFFVCDIHTNQIKIDSSFHLSSSFNSFFFFHWCLNCNLFFYVNTDVSDEDTRLLNKKQA